jgi:hypothetical protein
MKRSRKTWLFLFIVVVIIQFIQPKKNISKGITDSDISNVYAVPEPVHRTLTQKCYDCHSNHTRYPWYFNVQPIGWWLAAHIYEGKERLNFSEFRSYQADTADHKLEEIIEAVKDREMPIKGYVFLHPRSAITADDEQAIHAWINTVLQTNN